MTQDTSSGWRDRYVDESFEGVRREITALHRLFDQARVSDKEAIKLALDAADRAVNKAETATDARLSMLNEIRRRDEEREARYAKSETVDERFSGLSAALSGLSDRVSAMEGRLLGIATVGSVVAIAGAVYAVVK